MIQPVSSESAFAALFLLLSNTQLGGTNAFTAASSRRLPPVANVASVQQPAVFFLESDEEITEDHPGLPREDFKVAAIVLFRTAGDLKTVTSTQMNNLRDAVVNQLRNFTLSPGGVLPVIPKIPGERQTLGGLVNHCRIHGKVLKNEGLQNQQGALVFPISILAGM